MASAGSHTGGVADIMVVTIRSVLVSHSVMMVRWSVSEGFPVAGSCGLAVPGWRLPDQVVFGYCLGDSRDFVAMS